MLKRICLVALTLLVACGHDRKTARAVPDAEKQEAQSHDGCVAEDPSISTQPMLSAVVKNDATGVQALLNLGMDPNMSYLATDGSQLKRTALICAIESHHPEMAKLLLEHGANPNQANNYGVAPLYFAIGDGDAATACELLKHGADPNQPTDWGATALTMAVLGDNTALVEILLADPRTDINVGTGDNLPLQMAGFNPTGSLKMVQLLLDHGADPNKVTLESFNNPEARVLVQARRTPPPKD